MKKNRKKKFVVWLCNFTDSRDDDWVSVWATSKDEAFKNAEYNSVRFSKGHVFTASEFYKQQGIHAL